MKIIIIFVFSFLLLAACSNGEEKNSSEDKNPRENNAELEEKPSSDENEIESPGSDDERENIEDQLTQTQSEQVMIDYKEIFMSIVESTDEKGVVDGFKFKEEIHEHLSSAMSDELAQWYVDTYFAGEDDGYMGRQEEGEVYLKAMDGPTWLQEDEPFALEKGEEGEYRVIQEFNNEMLGHVNMIYVLKQNDEGKWIVKEIEAEKLE